MIQVRSTTVRFIFDNSLLLLAGTLAAVVWANVDFPTYDAVAHPLHFWVNDVGMVFFFALAAKEVFEATLPGGALGSGRQAVSPLAAAVGGMMAPAAIYAGLVITLGPADLLRGWAIPCATDIAFSAMVARVIFPGGHPAIPFLLLLAIADDALGLVILALFYPSDELSFAALMGLLTAAVVLAFWLRRRRIRSFWAYLLGPGMLSWTALYLGGFHPALALVPIVPFMPHSPRDLGVFDPREEVLPDTLNRFDHWWTIPVQFVLLVFGFANAGVPFAQIGPGTYYVLAALLIGKPVGILLFSTGASLLGARLPAGLMVRHVVVVGIVASIGFTVSLFFATAAFPGGAGLAETKMGALLSFVAAPLALIASWFARADTRSQTIGGLPAVEPSEIGGNQPRKEEPMSRPLAHGRPATRWTIRAPWWWFGAPVLAFGYVLLTPQFLPDIVSVPSNMSAALPALRWLVGVVVGVVALTTIHFIRWILSRRS